MTLDPPSFRAARAASGSPEPSLQCFQLWMEHSHDVIIEITPQGRLVDISANVKTVLGYEPAEIAGDVFLAHVHPEDLGQVLPRLVAPHGWGSCRYRHKDGSWRWIEASGRKFTNPNGEERIWLIARDITGRKWVEEERQQLEARLCQAQKSEILGTLAGGIAHDFNNILSAIILTTDLARLESGSLPVVQRRLEQVLVAGHRAKNLVQQILSFSRPQAPGRLPIMLHTVISEALSLLRATLPAAIEIRVDIRDSSGLVRADPTQVHQVLMNLCLNSVHAMPSRTGRIEVRLDSLCLDSHSTRSQPALPPGTYVRLMVTDTGTGMDAETIKRIFEPYFTTKHKTDGTGLGLAVVQQIVKSHHGAIHVTSRPGEGTIFEVLFPRHEAWPAPTDPAGIG